MTDIYRGRNRAGESTDGFLVAGDVWHGRFGTEPEEVGGGGTEPKAGDPREKHPGAKDLCSCTGLRPEAIAVLTGITSPWSQHKPLA